VPALHSAGDREGGAAGTIELGEPVGFMVTLENGFRFYFAGDTFVTGDMRLWADLFRPELAVLPIGGHFTMDPRAAAVAVELLGVKHVLPTHYGTFPILAGTPQQLRDELASRGVEGVTVHEPQRGESVS
jgi:L-ascorbate metabolism protein UlaG (beta-lactamase superfamily)